MTNNQTIILPESRKKGVTLGVTIALAFCCFGLGVATKGALTPSFSLPGNSSSQGSLPGIGGMPGGGSIPSVGGGLPAFKGKVIEVSGTSYTLETEMGFSVEVPLDSKDSVKTGDERELKMK